LKFSNAKWEDIASVCEAGEAAKHFAVGDTRTITIPWKNASVSSVSIELEIIGMGHDDLADGSGKAGITIGTKASLGYYYFCGVATGYMYNGWANSDIRTALNSTGFNGLPSDLRSHIKEVTKLSRTSTSDETATSSTDKLFVPSHTEFVGGTLYGVYGTQYEHYKTVENRKKQQRGKDSLSSGYAKHSTRTAIKYNGANRQPSISTTGSFAANDTEEGHAVVCFCI
jgi:hypothetical protein